MLRIFYIQKKTKNKKMDNTAFTIWMAGFYEGEGYVSNDKSKLRKFGEVLFDTELENLQLLIKFATVMIGDCVTTML